MTDTEIRLAFFGPQNSGKTTLLASYYGNQQRSSFVEEHGYWLRTETSAGNELLSRYYRMEDGDFPQTTNSFDEYTFEFVIDELNEPSFEIVWYDYPGEWWTRSPEDREEMRERFEAFTKLLKSHVGVLLIDGDKYRSKGVSYVKQILSQFKNEIRSIQDNLAKEGKTINNMPDQWIIGITKADLLSDDVTAKRICKDIVKNATEQLNGLAKEFGGDNFGHQYLMISSVQGEGEQVIDAHSYVGLELIVPVGFVSVLEKLSQAAGEDTTEGLIADVLEGISSVVDVVDQMDDFLPRKYQVLTHLIQAMNLKEGLDKGVQHFREKQKVAAEQGKALEAATAAMQAELSDVAESGAFYKNQM